jgi:hypothetical protein
MYICVCVQYKLYSMYISVCVQYKLYSMYCLQLWAMEVPLLCFPEQHC